MNFPDDPHDWETQRLAKNGKLMNRVLAGRLRRLRNSLSQQTLLRSNLIFSFDLFHVPALDDLAEDALVEKVLDIEFGDFGIT
jgi:hypothetical protein